MSDRDTHRDTQYVVLWERHFYEYRAYQDLESHRRKNWRESIGRQFLRWRGAPPPNRKDELRWVAPPRCEPGQLCVHLARWPAPDNRPRPAQARWSGPRLPLLQRQKPSS